MLKTLRLICFQKRSPSVCIARQFSYKSDISTEVLYPASKQKLFTPDPPLQQDKFNGYIPMNKIRVKYSRSSGPGGQHVNKVDTKVDLRFHVESSTWIPDAVRKRMLEQYKNQLNKDGYFVVKSELTRYQHLNLADALERVRNIIRKLEKETTSIELAPEKLAVIQRRHEKAARERLFEKRIRAQKKSDRLAG